MTQIETNQHKDVRGPVIREVKPMELAKIDLGPYTAEKPRIGWSVGFDPAPDPQKSVVVRVEIFEIKAGQRYICLLHNYGLRTVTATIRRLPTSRRARHRDGLWLYDDGLGGCIELEIDG